MKSSEFQNKIEAFLKENERHWFLSEAEGYIPMSLRAWNLLSLGILAFLIIKIFRIKKVFHPLVYSKNGTNSTDKVKKNIDKIGQGTVADLSSHANFAVIDIFGDGFVISDNKLYWKLKKNKKLFTTDQAMGVIELSKIESLTVSNSTFARNLDFMINGGAVGAIHVRRDDQVRKFLEKLMKELYIQYGHKI
jgi:hypothetical protein